MNPDQRLEELNREALATGDTYKAYVAHVEKRRHPLPGGLFYDKPYFRKNGIVDVANSKIFISAFVGSLYIVVRYPHNLKDDMSIPEGTSEEPLELLDCPAIKRLSLIFSYNHRWDHIGERNYHNHFSDVCVEYQNGKQPPVASNSAPLARIKGNLLKVVSKWIKECDMKSLLDYIKEETYFQDLYDQIQDHQEEIRMLQENIGARYLENLRKTNEAS